MTIKTLTISELMKDGVNSSKPIWIINSSHESAAKRGGTIYLTIPKRNGMDKDPLKIRHTWLPQCLTDAVTRPQLLSSSEFRALVTKKLITIITERSAQELLSTGDADTERERLDAEDRNIDEAGGARTITADVQVIGGEGDVDHNLQKDTPVSLITTLTAGDESELPAGISDAFGMFIDRAQEMGDAQCANAVRSYKAQYTKAELRFMKEKLKNSPKLQQMVAKTLDASK